MESSVPFSFNHWGIWPLDSRSADVFEEDLMKNADVFSLYFCFVSSIIDSRRYPNFIVQRLLFSYATTFWLSQFMRTSEWGDFGAKYRKAITADNSSRYATLMSSNFTYFPKNLLVDRHVFPTVKNSVLTKPPQPKFVEASTNYSCSARGSRHRMKLKDRPLFVRRIYFQICRAFLKGGDTKMGVRPSDSWSLFDRVDRKGLANGAI